MAEVCLMQELTFEQLVSHFFERSSAMQTYWGFYITVSIGVIAFIGSAKLANRNRYLVPAIVTCAYVGFAFVNAGGLMTATAQRRLFYGHIVAQESADSAQVRSLAREIHEAGAPPAPGEIKWFHIAADLAVLGALWTVALSREDVAGR
jgi:hypothetical protein